MATPIRLDASLLSAAQRAGAIQKRSIPKQIEFWAELGKSVEHVLDFEDVFAILQGVKRIVLEPVESAVVDSENVFAVLENDRAHHTLSADVTSAAVYFEASRTSPGRLDRVDTRTGERQTGTFKDGAFVVE